MEALGFPLQDQAELSTLTQDVIMKKCIKAPPAACLDFEMDRFLVWFNTENTGIDPE